MALVSIEPVKLTPWKWMKEFIAMPSKIGNLESELKRVEADNSRTRIIRFACDIRRGEEFDEESYGITLADIDKYNNYCMNNPQYENRKCVAAIDLIETEYRKHRNERSFLK